jgi:hypothetical protein
LKIAHKFIHHITRLHTKNHKKISLYTKVMPMISFLLEFKINQKVFSFKPDFINKSCRIILLDSNRTGLAIFRFFYKFLWILQVGCFEFERGYCLFTDRPLERFEPLQLDPWSGFTEGIDQRRPKSGEGAHRWQGAGEGKCSGTHGGHMGGRCRGREGL